MESATDAKPAPSGSGSVAKDWLRASKGNIIGVAQALNKAGGFFTDHDQALLEGIAAQSIPALRSSQTVERMLRSRPRRVLEIRADGSRLAERRLTILYMMRHGWEKVRGAAWCRMAADREPTLTPAAPSFTAGRWWWLPGTGL